MSNQRSRRAVMASMVFATAASIAACSSSTPATKRPSKQPSLDTGNAPWADPDHVRDRVAAAGLTGGATEVLTVHYHAHLDIFVNGAPEPVSGSIGREGQSFFSPLHTHATSGMIHIE